MALHIPLEDPKATAKAGAAIGVGCFVKYNAAATKVEICDGPDKHCCGVSAEAASADGDGIRIFALDQYARVQTAVQLVSANGITECRLTADGNGKAVKAGANQAILAVWCPKPGQTAEINDFITVQLVQSASKVVDDA